MGRETTFLVIAIVTLLFLARPAEAFGAGNIASVSQIEGRNYRHGDIEDFLKTVICLKGHKWTSMMVKKVYFGNWLRDYSQAIDVGTLKGVQADTIRVLIWVLSFMAFGYATEEFEVTAERLGTYRPEEHIDNPKDYADNVDARQYDPRLRPPVQPIELEIDPDTGMKNYIANEKGHWATSAGYIRFSFARSIHFGRVYTHGTQSGRDEDLNEALRCLGQGLHCLEDFGAHTNYVELALRELGFHNVFPHVGANSAINLRGKHVFPLVTGTFGGVDFLHSVLGEATDHVTQSEVQQMDDALSAAASGSSSGQRGFGDSGSGLDAFTSLLSQVPGTSSLVQEARDLQRASDEEASRNARGMDTGYDNYSSSRDEAPPSYGEHGFESQRPAEKPFGQSSSGSGINVNIDPQAAIKKIYPLLAFRDKVVRTISGIVSKIPGLEKMIETISERVTLFIMGLLAPYMKPIIAAATNGLKTGSSTVVSASAKQQYLVWEDPHSTDPTHSMLSKDHFSQVLNDPAGQVASTILQYVAPRIVYAWEHPEVPEHEVLDDVVRVFHHPAIRDHNLEIHRRMFEVVELWVSKLPNRGSKLNDLLSSESVKAGKNHIVPKMEGFPPVPGGLGHSATAGGPLAMFGASRGIDPSELQRVQGGDNGFGFDQPQQTEYQNRPDFGYGGGQPGGYQQEYQGGQSYQQQYGQPSYNQGYAGQANQGYQEGYPGQQGGYGGQYPPNQGYDQYGQSGGYNYR